MAKKNTPEVNAGQKVQTKYDRKMEARKIKEKKDKRDEKIFKIVSSVIGIAIVLGIVAGAAVSVVTKQTALKGTYIQVNERKVSELEFDYYYNSSVNNYLTTYGSLISYMGLDTTKDFSEQAYSDEMSWKDMFEQMAVQQMTQIFALSDDAKVNGFTYDDSEDYAERVESIKTAAENAGVSVSEYYKSAFGEYATEKNVAPFMKENLLAVAYYNELLETNAPSDEEIDAYYQENKQSYDKVDFRSFAFTADLAEDASEEDINKTMEELEKQADAFMEERKAGKDFEELCIKYAPEESKANYEDADSELSLSEGVYYSGAPYTISEWLYDDARKEGDITVLADETNHQVYVAEFISKYYDEADDANISSVIASDKVTDYIADLVEKYEIIDSKYRLKYLTVNTEPETEDTATDEAADEESQEEDTGEASGEESTDTAAE